jgi:cell fate regulator YaaT (PSP1 superfamily)
MPNVVGVRFKKTGKTYNFDPNGLEITDGWVVVETETGVECAEVAMPPHDIPDTHVVAPLKKVVRIATAEDMDRLAEREAKQQEALEICTKKIEAHVLDMKLVDVDIAFDGGKIMFFFTADGRVDFRELVKDLAHEFRTRIELRQIGVRDEAKMLGGLGPCGRVCCCHGFLKEFIPVSIRMAKEQSLSLNPSKISGLCGRLMCCLKYEQSNYEEARKRMPKPGRELATPDGTGFLLDNNLLKQTCRVRITLPDGTPDIRHYSLEDIERAAQGLPPIEKKAPEWEMPEVLLRSERRDSQQTESQPEPEKAMETETEKEKERRRPPQRARQGSGQRRRRPQGAQGQSQGNGPSTNAASRGEEQSASGENTPRRRRPQGAQGQSQGNGPSTNAASRGEEQPASGENTPRRRRRGSRGGQRRNRGRRPEGAPKTDRE